MTDAEIGHILDTATLISEKMYQETRVGSPLTTEEVIMAGWMIGTIARLTIEIERSRDERSQPENQRAE